MPRSQISRWSAIGIAERGQSIGRPRWDSQKLGLLILDYDEWRRRRRKKKSFVRLFVVWRALSAVARIGHSEGIDILFWSEHEGSALDERNLANRFWRSLLGLARTTLPTFDKSKHSENTIYFNKTILWFIDPISLVGGKEEVVRTKSFTAADSRYVRIHVQRERVCCLSRCKL